MKEYHDVEKLVNPINDMYFHDEYEEMARSKVDLSLFSFRCHHLFFECCILFSEKEANMGLRALPLSSSHKAFSPNLGVVQTLPKQHNGLSRSSKFVVVSAKVEEGKNDGELKKSKQSLFSSVTEALDFSQVRSAQDAELLEEAREATRSGGKMSREQYGALRRKIGGTYKDFFKSYIDVDGQYVEEGWVDKTCKVCKKDTRGEARQVDKFGRYVHVACLEKSSSGNFFTRLFSR